jgi:predicted glutamine amidotransferase
MCGLVGVLGPASKVNRLIFQDMLCMDVKRGPHSTGIMMANKKEAWWKKNTELPWDFLRDEEVEGKFKEQYPVLMGHNRWATVGDVTAANAHPFHHGKIILMHNGTLDAPHKLHGWSDFDTDSECLAYNISRYGIKDTWKKVDGAATLTWWDLEERSLNVISNCRRPFNFIVSENGRTMYWSSEEWVFRMACMARGVALPKVHLTLAKDMHYQFYSNGKNIKRFSEKLEGFPLFTVTTPSPGSHGVGFPLTGKKNKKEGTSTSLDRIEEPEGLARGLMTYQKWSEDFPDVECALCYKTPFWNNAVLVDKETAVCGECVRFASMVSTKLF